MAEEITFSLPDNDIAGISNQTLSMEALLNKLFAEKQNHDVMCNRLERYHWGRGTFPQVKDFSLELVKQGADILSGSFRCRFRVTYDFTCSGITSGENDTIAWQYNIDTTANTIHLQGEQPLERIDDI